MAHQFESGMFGNATPAWHGLGVVIPGHATTEEALRLGGIDWEVEKRPAYTLDGKGNIIAMPNRCAIVRKTDDAVLGDASDDYQLIQIRQAFSAVDIMVGEKEAKWETALAVKGGKQYAGVLSLAQTGIEIRKGDKQFPFLTVIGTHDGSGSVKYFPTFVRVVCANTIDAALGRRDASLTLNISHRGDVEEKLSDAASVLEASAGYFAGFGEFLQTLVTKKVTKGKLAEWIEAVMPSPKAGDTPGLKAAQTAHAAKVQLLLDCVKQETLLLPERTRTAGESAYELFNGYTRFIDHNVAASKGEGQFEYAMVGTGNAAKSNAVKALGKVFGVALPK